MRGKLAHRDRRIRGTVIALLALTLGLALPALAGAQTFTVTNLENSGAGSLREAVVEANASAAADTVVFAPGLSGTIALTGEGIVINEPLDIEGPGSEVVTVEQTASHRVFNAEESLAGAPVTIAGLHIDGGIAPTGGADPGIGGDVINTGGSLTLADDLITGAEAKEEAGVASIRAPLTVRSSVISGNHALYSGGGIGVFGTFSIVGSTISGNSSEVRTGLEIYVGGSDSGTIEGSTISGNQGREGAFLYALEDGRITVRNSTFAGNEGRGLDLGTHESGTIAIEGSTVADNHSSAAGGGIQVEVGAASTLSDTIVADNGGTPGPDVSGPIGAAFSLIGDPTGATLTETVPGSNLLGVDPQLGPLAANGGPTETMALAPTSPAVNKGGGGSLTTDQRGEARPVIYPGVALSSAVGADGSDIGAYELQLPPPAPPPTLTTPVTSQPPSARKKPSPPRVKVSCPKSAAPTGCHFALQVFSAKPHRGKAKGRRARAVTPVAESLVAVANVRPGKSAQATLTPKPKFAAKLDAAKSLLVRVAATVGGRRSVSYRRLTVIG